MALSFADSLKKSQKQPMAEALQVASTLPASADIAIEQMNLAVNDDINENIIAAYSGDDGNWVEHTAYEHYSDYSDDNVSIIDDKKYIAINAKQINITQEENSQLIPFEMPRYYDGFDLTKTNISIHYETKDGYHGVSQPVNVAYNNEKIKFSWLIDAKVTHISGTIKFEIHAVGMNSRGDAYVWKTHLNTRLSVSQSLCSNCENTIVLDDSWVQELITAVTENIVENKIAEEQVFEQIEKMTTDIFSKEADGYLPKISTVVLLTESWIGNDGLYSQELVVDNVSENSKLDLYPTAMQIAELQKIEVTLMLQNNSGIVTAWAIGDKPTKDFEIQILIQNVITNGSNIINGNSVGGIAPIKEIVIVDENGLTLNGVFVDDDESV